MKKALNVLLYFYSTGDNYRVEWTDVDIDDYEEEDNFSWIVLLTTVE